MLPIQIRQGKTFIVDERQHKRRLQKNNECKSLLNIDLSIL
jgi:hypothetical protein